MIIEFRILDCWAWGDRGWGSPLRVQARCQAGRPQPSLPQRMGYCRSLCLIPSLSAIRSVQLQSIHTKPSFEMLRKKTINKWFYFLKIMKNLKHNTANQNVNTKFCLLRLIKYFFQKCLNNVKWVSETLKTVTWLINIKINLMFLFPVCLLNK